MESVSSAEAKLANLITRRHKLTPGFDVAEFLAIQADLRFGNIPGDVDGISINLKSKDQRPIVIISNSLPPTRRKFTMAHELGHIFIPWHIGTIFSHTNENHAYANRLYHDCETEANRFAAELLMPTEWVSDLLSKMTPSEVHSTILRVVGTSPEAAFYKVGSLLSDDYVGVLTSLNGRVRNSVSTNARLQSPEIGELISNQAVYKNATSKDHSLHTNNIIYWLKYPSAAIPKNLDDRSWREVLDEIIEEVEVEKRLVQSLNGCISCINRNGMTYEAFYNKAHQRIASDNKFQKIFGHPDFDVFLAKRIREFVKK